MRSRGRVFGLSVSLLPRVRVRSRGRVVGLSVSLLLHACMRSRGRVFGLSVCPPLFGLFVHFQGLIIHLTGKSGEKSSQ